MVFVDDGSRDRTLEVATEHRAQRSARSCRQVPPQLRPDAGHGGRHRAGARPGARHDGRRPAERPGGHRALFLAKIDEGNDIVVGWRFNRQDKLISRKIPSRIANWLIGKVTGVPIKDNGCSLKAYRGVADQGDSAVLRDAPLHPGHGLDRGPAHRRDQGAPSRAPVRPVEVRPVAGLQGPARPDGHQDGRLVHRAAAPVVQHARDAARS